MVTKVLKFRLLWWKNWKVQLKQKKQLAFEILLPFIISGILIIIRKGYDINYFSEDHFKPFSIRCSPADYNGLLNSSFVIAYSPSNNSEVRKIAEQVALELNSVTSKPKFKLSEHSTTWHLNNYILAENPFIGIEFKDELKDTNGLPKKLEYALRFRAKELLFLWETEHIVRVKRFSDEGRNLYQDQGGTPSYNERCFLLVQNTIDRYFINKLSPNTEFQEITLNRFPEKEYSKDTAYKTFIYVLPLLILINYTFAVDNIISSIAFERERNLKVFLKALGVSKSLQWSAWMLKALCLNLISITIFSLMLTSFLYGTQQNSIFYYSNAFLIWLFLLFYLASVIAFSGFMSLFCKKAKISAVVGIIVWIISYIPYNLVTASVEYFDSFNSASHFFLAILLNTGMGFGFNTIFALEWKETGLTWATLFTRVENHGLSVAEAMLSLLLSTVIFLFLTVHLEKIRPEFSKPRKWYHPFKQLYDQFVRKEYETLEEIPQGAVPSSLPGFQKESSTDECSVIMKGLTKIFKKKRPVLDNFHLNLYQDQITFLVGNSGCGKSTVLSLLEGIYPATEGGAIIYGKDLKQDIHSIRELYGIRFQSGVLIDYLTVSENIEFFCRLRGLTGPEITAEVQKYTDALNLRSNLTEQVRRLKYIDRLKLSVAVALCGDTKIVLLDEPTLRLDPEDKDKVWELLEKEKRGRTIFVASQSLEEANIYGERIVVMQDGEIKAVGSPAFLRKTFGIGYRLTCIKKEDCDPEQITDILKSFIPDIEIDSNTESTLTYILNESYLSRFPEMFDSLENQFYSLRLSSFSVSLANLENLLMRTSSNTTSSSNGHQSNEAYFGLNDEVPIVNSFDAEQQRFTRELNRIRLLGNQILAMIKKKLYYLRHSYKFYLANIILSMLFIIVILYVPNDDDLTYTPLQISLSKEYSNAKVYIQSDNSSLAKSFQTLIEKSLKVIKLSSEESMEEYVVANASNYLMGLSFGEDQLVAWFNNDYYHVLPLLVNLINQAYLNMTSGPDYSLNIVNKPFHIPDKVDIETKLLQYSDSETLAIVVSVLYIYWITLFMTPHIKEKASGSKSMQFICGINRVTYWLWALLMDVAMFLIAALFMIMTIMFFNVRSFFTGFGILLNITTIFSLSALPLMYLMSRSAKESFNAKMNLVLTGFFSGVIPYTMVLIMALSSYITAQIFYVLLMVSPFFVLYDVLYFLRFYTIKDMLDFFCGMYELHQCNPDQLCEASGKFCDTLLVNDMVTSRLFFMFSAGVFYFCLLMAIEYKSFDNICSKKRIPAVPDSNENLELDVKEENQRVESLTQGQIAEHSIVMKNCSSKPGKLPEIRNFSIIVEESSCLVILGPKHSGKSLILKMLVGEEAIYSGDAYTKNLSVRRSQSDVCRKIGYCSNQFAFVKYLSGQENLEIFGLAKGIPSHSLQSEIRHITDDLRIKDLGKPVRTYNITNRKKMCLAIALIGDPQILLLDNPLKDLDLTSKRQFLAILNKLKAKGKTIILTTEKLDECESICNRLAIIKDGELICLGAPQYLKKKLSKGVNLNIKLRKQEEVLKLVLVDGIKDFIQRSFQKINRCTESANELSFSIDNADLRWSEIFGTMEDLKEKFEIENYSITETSLEQVYGTLTERLNY